MVIIVLSCERRGRHTGIASQVSRPDETSTLYIDSLTDDIFHDIIDCQDIHVIDDTILVIKEHISSLNNYHFKAYSTNSLRPLGSFAISGRGPGELLSPYIVHCNSSEGLFVKENSTGLLHRINVIAAINGETDYLSDGEPVSPYSLDCIPITDSTILSFCLDGNDYVFQLTNSENVNNDIFKLYAGFGERAVTHLSSMFTSNTDLGRIVQFMVFFPQYTILSANGNCHSFAIYKKYSQWRTLFSNQLSPESIQYYTGVTSDKQYIYASYVALPLKKLQDASFGTEIHIFDWSGHFVHSIKVREDIDNLAIDSINKRLYCRRRSDHSIIRYNLSRILQ